MALERSERLHLDITVAEDAEMQQRTRVSELVQAVQTSLLSGATNKNHSAVVARCKQAEVVFIRLVSRCDDAYSAALEECCGVPEMAAAQVGIMERFVGWHLAGEGTCPDLFGRRAF